MNLFSLLHQLAETHTLSLSQWETLISGQTPELAEEAARLARLAREPYYGKRVFIRGLIEISNFCKNDCYYCGIRRSNRNAMRYRLTPEQILSCCETGWALGFRTFVLQGGEDPWFTDERVCQLVRQIKARWPEAAVTLSIGEREEASYQAFRQAGADRYLLRHETADDCHYHRLHPSELSLAHRMDCLRTLKRLGFQTGAGFMVGSPGQTAHTLAEDMVFLQELEPEMVGIGPFLPHHDTPFAKEPAGDGAQTLYLLSLVRLMLPAVLLPATTALGTLLPNGREQGMEAGANVVMPNLSPGDVRDKYLLYDNKLHSGDEAAESVRHLRETMAAIGYQVVADRGDHWKMAEK